MKQCEQTQIRLLDGVSLSPEEQRHLESCPACREFAAFAERAVQFPLPEKEIPSELDSLILQAAESACPKRVRIPIFWRVAIPAAAAFALVAGVLFYQPFSAGESARQEIRRVEASASAESSFDEQVFSLAADVGSGMDSFSETMDLFI